MFILMLFLGQLIFFTKIQRRPPQAVTAGINFFSTHTHDKYLWKFNFGTWAGLEHQLIRLLTSNFDKFKLFYNFLAFL